MLEILRHHIELDTGASFYFDTEDRANRFQERNEGSVYHGLVNVPKDSRPPILQN